MTFLVRRIRRPSEFIYAATQVSLPYNSIEFLVIIQEMCAFVEVIGAEDGLIVIFGEYLGARLVPRDHFSVAIELLMDHTPD